MDTELYGSKQFFSRIELFGCGLANWLCMSKSVQGNLLVCMVSTVKLIPLICHVCFASSVCFPRDSSFWKINFAWLCQIETSVAIVLRGILYYFYLPDCFVSWAQYLDLSLSLLTLLSDTPESKHLNFPDPVGWKRSTSWPLTKFSIISHCEFLNFRS